MENPFKKLVHPPKEAPKGIKKKVMDDISAFKLFTDIAGLFSINYSQAAATFFKKRKNNQENNK